MSTRLSQLAAISRSELIAIVARLESDLEDAADESTRMQATIVHLERERDAARDAYVAAVALLRQTHGDLVRMRWLLEAATNHGVAQCSN